MTRDYTNASGHTITVNDPKRSSIGESWMRIGREMEAEKKAWIADLRAYGVKAAHPNDGWVDREKHEVFLCYPQFNDGVTVGDTIALGSPGRKTLLVKVIGSRALFLDPSMVYWEFEPPPTPEPAPNPPWWKFWL